VPLVYNCASAERRVGFEFWSAVRARRTSLQMMAQQPVQGGPPLASPPPSLPGSPPSSPLPVRPAELPPSQAGLAERVADVRLPPPSAVLRSLKTACARTNAIEWHWRTRVLQTIVASATAGHALGAGSRRVVDEEAAKPKPDPWLRYLARRICEQHDVRLFNGLPTELTSDDERFYRDLLQLQPPAQDD
jgi:hypothetical protein